ncbi:succinate dehydrogenase iron-sulfur subunit [Chloroflexi bacterium CFX5]|nr:succinate dehydrogenase iron-sulfur subunit [Chloroflexota bacterium]MDL1920690.1 succinate dehydrogenase iron-sulfur subunit [Chloroflexi bacterium CFX5]NUQ60669.1 succinate dehydrogenase iron-sulfur subunit [Anaerolineales bacterium]
MMSAKQITFRIRRYDPDKDAAPHWEEYKLNVHDGMTVLEALHEIKAEQAPTLAWRSSCRMGVCGSCGMFINNLPMLACQTQVLHLDSDVVTVAPLPNYDNVKDLVPNLEPLIEKHAAIKPFIIHPNSKEIDAPTGEFLQTPEQRDAYSQFTFCIKCGLCLSACPTVATDALFLGPQALAQAYRYTADSRDCGLKERLEALDVFHGPYQCHMAGACSQACPKGVDPALGIQLLKRTLVLDGFGFGKKEKQVSKVAPLADVVKQIEEFAPPPRTAK